MLKLQSSGHLMQRADSFEKTLMLGKIEGRRRRGRQRMRCLDIFTDSMDMSFSKLWKMEGQGSLACCSPCSSKQSDTTEWLNKNKVHRIYIQMVFGLIVDHPAFLTIGTSMEQICFKWVSVYLLGVINLFIHIFLSHLFTTYLSVKHCA